MAAEFQRLSTVWGSWWSRSLITTRNRDASTSQSSQTLPSLPWRDCQAKTRQHGYRVSSRASMPSNLSPAVPQRIDTPSPGPIPAFHMPPRVRSWTQGWPRGQVPITPFFPLDPRCRLLRSICQGGQSSAFNPFRASEGWSDLWCFGCGKPIAWCASKPLARKGMAKGWYLRFSRVGNGGGSGRAVPPVRSSAEWMWLVLLWECGLWGYVCFLGLCGNWRLCLLSEGSRDLGVYLCVDAT